MTRISKIVFERTTEFITSYMKIKRLLRRYFKSKFINWYFWTNKTRSEIFFKFFLLFNSFCESGSIWKKNPSKMIFWKFYSKKQAIAFCCTSTQWCMTGNAPNRACISLEVQENRVSNGGKHRTYEIKIKIIKCWFFFSKLMW